MIQLYCRFQDLTYTEQPMLSDGGIQWIEDHLSQIQEEGIRKALSITPEGLISYGNSRYFIAREMGLKYLPIDLAWLLGLQHFPEQKAISIRSEVLDFFSSPLTNKKAVLPIQYKAIPCYPYHIKKLSSMSYFSFDHEIPFYSKYDVGASHASRDLELIAVLRKIETNNPELKRTMGEMKFVYTNKEEQELLKLNEDYLRDHSYVDGDDDIEVRAVTIQYKVLKKAPTPEPSVESAMIAEPVKPKVDYEEIQRKINLLQKQIEQGEQ